MKKYTELVLAVVSALILGILITQSGGQSQKVPNWNAFGD